MFSFAKWNPTFAPKKTWDLSLQRSEGSMASYVQPIVQRIGCSAAAVFEKPKAINRNRRVSRGTFFWGGWRVVYFWFQIAKKHRCKVWKNSSVASAAKPAQQFTELVGYSIKHGVPAHLRWWSPNSFSSTVLPLILKRKKKQGEEGEATNNPVSNDPFFSSFSSIHPPSILLQQPWRLPNLTRDDWQNCRWKGLEDLRPTSKNCWLENALRAPIYPCHLFPSRVSLFLVSFEHSDLTWSYFGWLSLACWYCKPEVESRL